MLGVAKMTSGIGVRTAHSILFIFTKRRLWSRILISVSSAKQRKITETV